ncbi:MAG: hypothetical protein ACREA9_04985 [Pyrinomonadaceae bacterium]
MIHYLRLLGFSLFCIGSISGNVSSQERNAANLTRENVVVTWNKPTVYICADLKLNKSKNNSTKDGNIVWLRVYNNTIWTIRFGATTGATLQKALVLPNGSRVAGLTDDSVFFPRYEFESNSPNAEAERPAWGDFGTASWLPSNVSAVFSVPQKYFANGKLFLTYKYQWEFTGTIGDESHAPVHRVYFDAGSVSDIWEHLCNLI